MMDISKFQRPKRVVVAVERGEVVRRRRARKARAVVVRDGVVVDGPLVVDLDRPLSRAGLVVIPARSPAAVGWRHVAGVVFAEPEPEPPNP